MTPEFCQNLSQFAFGAAKAFIWLAFFAAIAHVIVYSVTELRKARNAGLVATPAGLEKILEALKGVLEALAKLPHWVAIFLAGMALLWTAATAPGLCPA